MIMSYRSSTVKGSTTPNFFILYMIIEVLGDGVYRLKIQDGELILQTWNATNLKFYFSSDI